MIGNMKGRMQQFQEQYQNRGRLLINCPDPPGIVAAVSKFLFEQGANIIESSQYTTNPQGGNIFMRVEFECPRFKYKKAGIERVKFQTIARSFSMEWTITYANDMKKPPSLYQKSFTACESFYGHGRSGDLLTDICLDISNHEDGKRNAEPMQYSFLFTSPATKENRAEVEEKQSPAIKGT